MTLTAQPRRQGIVVAKCEGLDIGSIASAEGPQSSKTAWVSGWIAAEERASRP